MKSNTLLVKRFKSDKNNFIYLFNLYKTAKDAIFNKAFRTRSLATSEIIARIKIGCLKVDFDNNHALFWSKEPLLLLWRKMRKYK